MNGSVDDFEWPIPRSAYLHVPFCRHRCGYCNFSVIANRDDLMERFVSAIDSELSQLERPAIDTLFIGGGTPTHLPHQLLTRLLKTLNQRFEFAADMELTVEANPEDINRSKLQCLADHGVNRISLGVQSFQPAKLQRLERSHSAATAKQAIELAHGSLGNVSIDLIFASPEESLLDWESDLRTALALPITHLSTYALTFEKGTKFWNAQSHGRLSGVDESVEVEMYQRTRQMTADRQLKHYEISNFAADGFRCRHNIAYWEGCGWYAAGPGAARFVDGRREVNHRSTTTYLQRIERGDSPTAESEPIERLQYARERAAFGVRMIDGIDLHRLSKETGMDLLKECEEAIERMIDLGWLLNENGHVRITEAGILFADSVASELLG